MALVDRQVLKQNLMSNDPRFAAMVREHTEYEQELAQLSNLHFPTPEEQLREHVLKKKKLILRDRMEELLEATQRPSRSIVD